jgi:hypothetical protein
VEHYRHLVDAVDVDAQGEFPSVFLRCRLDHHCEVQDATTGSSGTRIWLWNPDRTLSVRVIGFTSAWSAMKALSIRTRTSLEQHGQRSDGGSHPALAGGRRLGSGPNVDSQVTPATTVTVGTTTNTVWSTRSIDQTLLRDVGVGAARSNALRKVHGSLSRDTVAAYALV